MRVSEKGGETDKLIVSLPDIAERVGIVLGKEGTLDLEGSDELASPTTVITRHRALQVASSVRFSVVKSLPITLAQAVIVEVLRSRSVPGINPIMA